MGHMEGPSPAAEDLQGIVVGGISDPGSQDLRGLIFGTRWDTGFDVTYDFPSAFADYGSYAHTVTGFATADLAQRTVIRLLLEGADGIAGRTTTGTLFAYNNVESLTLLRFVDLGANDAANISVANVDFFDGADLPNARVADFPRLDQRSDSGDVWFGDNFVATRTYAPGNYFWQEAAHELGHALGLKHGHDASYGQFSTAMTAEKDNIEFSIMTYRSYRNGPTSGGYTLETWGYPQTYMMYDIAALQQLYGANYATNAGNTVYRWSPTTGEMSIDGVGQGAPGAGAGGSSNRVFLTIWDGGGVDTYDMSNYTTGVQIDLEPGRWSTTSSVQKSSLGAGNFALGNVYNALLHLGDARSVIENANGGSSHDYIVGNAWANELYGNDGNDVIDARAGGDVVYAGTGDDFVAGGDGFDILIGDAGNDILYAGEGSDYVVGGPGTSVISGEGGNDNLYGGPGADYIIGGQGDDTMVGLGGQDSLYGLEGNDYMVAGDGVGSVVDGGAGANTLWAGNGNDYMVGGEGIDLIVGGAGSDLIFAKEGDDTIYGGLGEDYIYTNAGNDYVWTDDFGLSASDYIYVGGGTGSDLIFDFTPGIGATRDVLVVSFAGTGFTSFADIQAHASQVEVYTVITLGADLVYLYNVQPFLLTASNFIFA